MHPESCWFKMQTVTGQDDALSCIEVPLMNILNDFITSEVKATGLNLRVAVCCYGNY